MSIALRTKRRGVIRATVSHEEDLRLSTMERAQIVDPAKAVQRHVRFDNTIGYLRHHGNLLMSTEGRVPPLEQNQSAGVTRGR